MKNKITLTLPAPTSRYADSIAFDDFQKPQLESFCRKLKSYLVNCDIELSDNTSPKNRKTLSNITDGLFSAILKPALVEFLTAFYSNRANMAAVIKAAAPRFDKVWRYLMYNLKISQLKAEELAGETINIISTNSWSSYSLVHPLLFGVNFESVGYFRFTERTPKSKVFFFLSVGTRKKMASLLLPTGTLDAHVLTTVPTEGVKEDFETLINSEILSLAAYSSANPLIGTSDNISYAKIKALQKKLSLADLADYNVTGVLSRNQMLGSALAYMHLHNRMYPRARKYDPESAADLAAYIVGSYPSEMGATAFRTLLPYYQGFTKSVIKDHRAAYIMKYICTLLRPAAKGWLDMSNFMLRYLSEDDKISSPFAAYTSLFRAQNMNYSIELSDTVPPSASLYRPGVQVDMWTDLTWSFVKSVVRLLVAAGCLEQVFVAESSDNISLSEAPPAERAFLSSYVRLTPLGLYAFGLKKKYNPRFVMDCEGDLDLDERNMIITLLRPESPLRFYLERYARPIGGDRFHLSPMTIVAPAKDSSEVLKAVETLRGFIKPTPDSKWETLLKESELRAAARRESDERYILVLLNTECPGLVEFINSHSEIRSRIVRAEGGRLLVPAHYYDEFQKVLRKAGYLL